MNSLATKHNDPDAKLGWGERIGYGTFGFGFNAINGIIGSFLTIYLTKVSLLDLGIISTLIAVSKVFDGISDIIVGRMVDNTHSRLGKARVWLLRMCIPFAVSTVLLFFVPQNLPTMVKYVYVFLMYNVVNTICLTALQVPFYSMISLISRNAYERGFLGNVQQIFQTLGNVVVNSVFVVMLTKFSSSRENYLTQQAFTITMIIFGVIMIATALITVLFTKERVTDTEAAEAQKKDEAATGEKIPVLTAVKALLTNKYWVLLTIAMFVVFFVIIFYSVGGVYYAQFIFNDMSQISWMNNAISIAQFAIMFATPMLMTKLPKHVCYTIGMGLMALGFLGFGLVAGTGSVPLMIVCNVLKGLGLGMSGGMALGMVADTILYGQLKTGIDAVGMGNAGVSAAQKLGLGLGQAVFGWVLSAAGYKGTLKVQPQSVSTAIQFIYSWIPFLMCAVIFVFFLLVYRNIERDLAALKEQNGIRE